MHHRLFSHVQSAAIAGLLAVALTGAANAQKKYDPGVVGNADVVSPDISDLHGSSHFCFEHIVSRRRAEQGLSNEARRMGA